MTEPQHLLDTFGSERADDDYARGGAHKDMFLETASVCSFLSRDPSYRYVLGTMGAGKSILLIKLREHVEANQKGSILAPISGPRAYTPSPEFAQSVRWTSYWKLEKRGEQDITAWTQIWEWALLASIMHRWAKWAESNDDGNPYLGVLRDLLASSPQPSHDPFTSIARFIDAPDGLGPSGNLVLPRTSVMREFVEANVNSFPPTYAFLDNQDDFFQNSPDFWTASALGCKYAIDQIVRRSNHRIHLVMTLRPEVLWRTQTDADALRHHGVMFRIDWTSEQLMEIFSRRAALLKDELLMIPNLRHENPLAAFFGDAFYEPTDHERTKPLIENCSVGNKEPIREPIEQYLYRHTLGRPREMIMLGNRIIERRRNTNAGRVGTQAVVREAVGGAAHDIALAYLGEIKQRWPWRSSSDGQGEAPILRFLRDFVRSNVLDASDMQVVERDYRESCDSPTKDTNLDAGPFSVLASAGLIGWPQRDVEHGGMVYQYFPRTGAPDRLTTKIPKKIRKILVHPVLYGPEFAIEARKGVVVGPGVRTVDELARQAGLI